jgi:hypothetical protein
MSGDNNSQPNTYEPMWGKFAIEWWHALNRKLKIKNAQKVEPCYKEDEDEQEGKK